LDLKNFKITEEEKNKIKIALNKDENFTSILYGFPNFQTGLIKYEINGIYQENFICPSGGGGATHGLGADGLGADENENILHIFSNFNDFSIKLVPKFQNSTEDELTDGKYIVKAPMPCKILKINISEGSEVKKGTLIIMIESMKMNMPLYATIEGKVNILVKEGQTVKEKILY